MYVIENLTPYSPIAWLRPKLYTHATTSTTQILSCDRSKLRQAATPAKSHHSWLKSPVELIHFIYTRVDHCRAGVMHGATLQELFKPRPLRDHHTVFDCILRKPGKTTLSSKSIPSRCVAWLQIDVDSISSFTQKLNCHRKNWSPHHGCNQYLYNDKHVVRANQHTQNTLLFGCYQRCSDAFNCVECQDIVHILRRVWKQCLAATGTNWLHRLWCLRATTDLL